MLSHLAGPHWFWALLAAAVVIWYSTIAIYVAIRGAFDIKHMLDNLQTDLEQLLFATCCNSMG